MKLSRYLIVSSLFIFLTGCTSKQVLNAGCDFVSGASEMHLEHKARANRRGEKYDDDSYLIGGLFSLLSGAINRSLSSDKKPHDCP